MTLMVQDQKELYVEEEDNKMFIKGKFIINCGNQISLNYIPTSQAHY